MREIKFRTWNKHHKEMREVTKEWSIGDLDKNGFELMQYTGLKDKNGKEIYEGDVLLYDDTESEYVDVGIGGQGVKVAEQTVNSLTKVEFDEGCFGVTADSPYGETLEHGRWYTLRQLILEETSWVEIIGNIYEHPELIETNHD